MLRVNRHFVWSIILIFVVILNLLNVNIARADDSTPPPPTEEPAQPPEEPTDSPALETTAVPIETPVVAEGTDSADEQAPVEEEPVLSDVLADLPENTDVVVLDEFGNPIPLASQAAADAVLEDDPMWCPAGTLPGGAGCRNFTGASGITNLLSDMRTNTSLYDENGIIYFTTNPGNGAFILTDAAASLGSGDFATLRNFNITLQGGWNGSNGGAATFTGQTNFASNYIAVGTSSNPWIGNVTIQNMTVDGHTSANPSLSVYTTNGSATLNNIVIDDADTNESIRVSTGSGNISMTNIDVTDGDDNYALNLTTTSGSVTLTDVLVDDHTDADGIRIVGGNGTVTLNNVDVTDGSDGDGIDVTTTGGTVNLNGVDVDSQDGGNGINVTTTSGNINLNDADVSNHEDGRTANLNSQSGNINVFNNSDFEGDNTNQGFFATTNTGTITMTGIASATIDFTDAEGPGGTNYNGATLTAPYVSLTYVTSTDNDGSGIVINATNLVTLDQVVANNNGTNPPGAGNAVGSGVTVNGDGVMLVNVFAGSYANNERYGIEVINGTLQFASMSAFSNNGLGRYSPGGQDTTGPVITPTVDCLLGSWGNAGWCRGLMLRVTWSVTDPESRASSSCGATNIFSDTPPTGQTVTCTATSADGTLTNTASVTVYRDITNPGVSASRAPAPNAFGWNNTDVTVTFTGTDAGSGIASCTPPITRSANAAGQSATGNCTDVAGNTSSNATVNNINIDKIPPVITLTSRTPANGNGWNNTNVTLTWTCTDALSGVVTSTITQTLSSEGAGQSATGTCQDRAGNSATNTQTGINIDKTAPALTIPGNIIVEATGPLGATVNYTATATDALDSTVGPVCSPPSGSIFALTTTTINCSSTDDAGNSSSGSFNVTVQDTSPPALTLPANITVEAAGPSGAIVTFPASATDVVDGIRTVVCVNPSGSTFPITASTVNCSASDTRGNTANGSFTITVQDTTAPVISPMADKSIPALRNAAKIVVYSPPTTSDTVDGPGVATCTPPSGSLFPIGDTTVTCTATDSHGNTSSITFNVNVYFTPAGFLAPTGSSGFILVTGGELIDLDCSTVANAFGIIVKFHNLCDHQAVLNEIATDALPGELPAGYTFVKGLDVDVLADGQAMDVLPDDSGVEMDYPLSGGGEYAVLFWDGSQWVEITQMMDDGELLSILSKDAANELYKMSSSSISLLKVLTTAKTGTFVLVIK